MKLEELKKCIELENIPVDFMIFIRDEDNFLVNQYLNAICEINNLIKEKVNSIIEDQSALSLVVDYSNKLKVLDVDTFSEYLDDYSELQNTIVVCKKIDKSIQEKVKEYVIEFPKLVDWQIKDYMRLINKNLSAESIDWLFAACKGNINRIINELDKLSYFDTADQENILAEEKFNKSSDLMALMDYKGNYLPVDVFKVIDLIFAKDFEALSQIVYHKDFLDLDFISLTNLTLTRAKQILLINYQSGITAIDLNMSDAQFKYFKKIYRGYSEEYLRYLIKTLSEVDLKLKRGYLDMSNEEKLNYVFVKILSYRG